MTGAITHLIAGIRVSDLDAACDWYTRFFEREPDMRPSPEFLIWDIAEHGTVFIEHDPESAGTARVSFAVSDLDDLLERLGVAGISHHEIDTYSNGVRNVVVPDPDGNTLAFAEFPSD